MVYDGLVTEAFLSYFLKLSILWNTLNAEFDVKRDVNSRSKALYIPSIIGPSAMLPSSRTRFFTTASEKITMKGSGLDLYT